MTDNEISKALALAIGYPNHDIKFHYDMWEVVVFHGSWRIFDYKEWSVIGPIAERYDCFPYLDSMHKWDVMNLERYYSEDTPQKAIALAVIASQGDKT